MTSFDAVQVPLEGTMRVGASPGGGPRAERTARAIATRLVRLVAEADVTPRELLVVARSETAAANLRDELRRRLRDAIDALAPGPRRVELAELAAVAGTPTTTARARSKLTRALRELDLATVATAETLYRALGEEHAFESGARFDIEVAALPRTLVQEIADDYWAARVCALPPTLHRLVVDAFDLEQARDLSDELAANPRDLVAHAQSRADDALVALTRARAAWKTESPAVLQRLLADTLCGGPNATCDAPDLAATHAELDAYVSGKTPSDGKAAQRPAGQLAPCGTGATMRRPVGGSAAVFAVTDALASAIEEIQRALVLDVKRGLIEYVSRELPRRADRMRVQSPAGLRLAVAQALAGPRGSSLRTRLASRVRAVLVDDLEDDDAISLLRALFDGTTALIFVADPSRSVGTGARGGALDVLLGRTRRPPSGDGEGRRAAGTQTEILLFCRPPVRDGDEPPRVEPADLVAEIPAIIADDIAERLGSGELDGVPLTAQHVAVLTHTAEQARAVQRALRDRGVPTVLRSHETVLGSTEAEELELLLGGVLEPGRRDKLRTALATSLAGLAPEALIALEQDEAGRDAWEERLRASQRSWAERGIAHALRELGENLGTAGRLLREDDGERRMTNLLHLAEILHDAERRERLGMSGLLRWLHLARAASRSGRRGDAGDALRIETDRPGVTVLTTRASQELDWPVVYWPYAWEDTEKADQDDAFGPPPREDAASRAHPSAAPSLTPRREPLVAVALAEQLFARQLTRATRTRIVLWGPLPNAERSPLGRALGWGHRSARPPLAQLRDDAIRAELAWLEDASGGALTIRARAIGPRPSRAPAGDARSLPGRDLAARTFSRSLDTCFRDDSFSSLASSRLALSEPEAHGRDRDEVEDRTTLLPPSSTMPRPITLAAFPRGAKAGTLLHAVLQDYDFTSPDRNELELVVTRKLEALGYSDRELVPMLVEGVRAMLVTPLDRKGLLLGSIPRRQRLDELEFVFPVALEPHAVVCPAALSQVLETSPNPRVPAGYAQRLRELKFEPLRGFLRGFVDLVFERDGRYYVVDYKSNHLGADASDYDTASLTGAMTRGDYFLQYHVYVVAVHRWLRLRLRDYDYDRHFGGVYYLFVRGMSPRHPHGTGIFFDRPPRATIEGLSDLLARGVQRHG